MFEHYSEAVNWIHSRLKFGVKPGLKRMEWLLAELNHPEKNIPIIHVAGTNGKGSTISYMLHMLTEAGYKVGSFTSPYIETFNERISVNGIPISDQEMLELVNEVKPYVEKIEETDLGGPTEFEIITTMMFVYFGKYNKPDFLLLETGLGGRLDSTNIVSPLLSIITNIGYDHMNILGSTIAEIAAEKAGIIKHGVPIMTAVENESALHVITETAQLHAADLFTLGEEINIINKQHYNHGEKFSIQTPFNTFKDLVITMKGQHQIKNAALALSSIDYLVQMNKVRMTEEQIRKGLEKTAWKGRFELVNSNPEVIIDGAHNQEGIESLIETLSRHYPRKNIHILYSALKDKEYAEMINRLSSIATSMHFTSFDFPRAATGYELYSACKLNEKTYSESWQSKLDELLTAYHDQKEDIVVVTGSLYFISHIREYCREINRRYR
ncbi:bifunctional folylpolyglutamate synthase/dihydrofolate synthase [Metabacillus bambusae]|uniref:tetrahydrofolate synthase n=1 Tax=Metabacillus bambusae TaxID=2795218 RepID=A0ABS3N8X1_9BACI|nr:folylpolyglutamate synthase/dihydrofolate synthase family protein [Metabacillus bambusae]MBO1514747.1 bifunctional folylpolyglutamate synthase/dihydrofolate synthase [Metabacillus bambusae]